MTIIKVVMLASLILLAGCAGPNQAPQADKTLVGSGPATPAAAPAAPAPYYIYVTNEQGGDLTIVNGGTNAPAGTIVLGKRPRGIKLSPDRTQLFVALSGSPIAGPGV